MAQPRQEITPGKWQRSATTSPQRCSKYEKRTNKIETMEFITGNLKEIILAIIAISAVGIVIKVRKNKKSNKVTQKKNKVGGDMAGRDINK